MTPLTRFALRRGPGRGFLRGISAHLVQGTLCKGTLCGVTLCAPPRRQRKVAQGISKCERHVFLRQRLFSQSQIYHPVSKTDFCNESGPMVHLGPIFGQDGAAASRKVFKYLPVCVRPIFGPKIETNSRYSIPMFGAYALGLKYFLSYLRFLTVYRIPSKSTLWILAPVASVPHKIRHVFT